MGNDFNSDKRFNYVNKVAMEIGLDKICFGKDEYITGYLALKLRDGLQTILLEPSATFQIKEYHHYNY